MEKLGRPEPRLQTPTPAQQLFSSGNTVAFDVLRRATDDFARTRLIGKGGSCAVYSGDIDMALIKSASKGKGTGKGKGPEKQAVKRCAIKVLKTGGDATDKPSVWAQTQFAMEINVLTRVKHPNLVELYAYSIDGEHKCLVLERMEGSLHDRLLDMNKPPLGWQQRVHIILPVCRALVHLHSLEPKPLIHRDVKVGHLILPCCLY